MLVYRIEMEDGTGPYSGPDEVYDALTFTQASPNHPPPGKDGLQGSEGTHKYALPTLDALFTWFEGAKLAEVLAENGYGIAVYRCLETPKKGKIQIAFRPEKARREEWVSLWPCRR